MEILSSFTFRTVPTFVLAANDLTGPNGFIETLECVKVLNPLFYIA
jgi:hypothetical protein